MTKFGFYNNAPKISFDTHLINLHPDQRKVLLELRNFVRSIGDNVEIKYEEFTGHFTDFQII